jgi:hypothetical protein
VGVKWEISKPYLCIIKLNKQFFSNLKLNKMKTREFRTSVNWVTRGLMMALMACSLLFVACDKEDDDEDIAPLEETMTGLGDNDGLPTGQQFKLPDGVNLVGDMQGGTGNGIFSRSGANLKSLSLNELQQYIHPQLRADNEYNRYGIGIFVTVAMVLENTTSREITVTFPGGLIFICTSGYSQNGFLIQEVKVKVPANGKAYIAIDALCANLGRHASSSSQAYIFGPVTNNPLLIEIVNIVKPKRLPTSSETDYYTVAYKLQDIAWDVTEYLRLTDESRTYLKSLPQ